MPPVTPPDATPSHDETDYLRWERAPDHFRPDPDRSLTGIFPTLLNLLGAPTDDYPNFIRHLPAASRRPAKRVMLLMVDGFGFKEMAQSSLFRALHGEYGTWITSVFPSITSAALTSIYQALPPGRHGILGHLIWKDLPGAVVDMLGMKVIDAQASLAEAGFDTNRWKREAGIIDAPLPNGMKGAHLMPRAIVGSGLSSFCYGQTELYGYFEPLEGLAKAGRMLAEMESGWVGMYLSSLDTLGHIFGGDTPPLALAVRHIEESIQWMAGNLTERILEETTLMIVADHGQSTIKENVFLKTETWEWLVEHTRGVGFSGRVMHAYLPDGAPSGGADVRACLEEIVGDRGAVYPYEEVCGLTGAPPGDDWARRSLGDFVAILNGGCNWIKPGKQKLPYPYGSPLVSQHGAMSREEMIVPVTVAPLSALLGS